ncbi:aconitate hydratase AcnA [Actinomadura physcomitrii]|nr:aconitate hydratase AcnA [Actinomadura physcomitrii]
MPGAEGVDHFSLPTAEAQGAGPLSRLPHVLRILVEHLLRQGADDRAVLDHVRAVTARDRSATVPFLPRRIMLQDASGLPVAADLIALQDAVLARGGDRGRVQPRLPMDLIVDHAVEVDHWGAPDSAERNLAREMDRHADRYRFLRWAQTRMPGLRVFPPGSGICHQLNLEVIAQPVALSSPEDGRTVAGFDSVLGTDSHTTMINALAVLGWGVGGIEATATALGEPVMMRVPEVIGVRLKGSSRPGVLATDVALTLTALLREHGVVGKVIEFCGPGLAALPVPDRATIANMAPEYGATMAFFPADAQTLSYLESTGRDARQVALARSFLVAQGMLRTAESADPEFDEVIEFDLTEVRPTVAGPRRPDERLTLSQVPATAPVPATDRNGHEVRDGDVVIAAITSCTNTANPRALAAAGLLARNAADRRLAVPPWVKTSFSPGSRAASRLLRTTGLQDHLDRLGFHVVGHGCTTCMGNSGPLDPAVEAAVVEGDLRVAAVVSGNRNFEGRIHPLARLGYLASPPLVVALALAGTVTTDLENEPLAHDDDGRPVHLADLWPSDAEIDQVIAHANTGPDRSLDDLIRDWEGAAPPSSPDYDWDGEAGFIRRPPFLDPGLRRPQIEDDLRGARPLLVLGDAVTTDHISPVSRISSRSEAGGWLMAQGVPARSLASFSARRLNHDVMLRGAFANPHVRNLLVPGSGGGVTRLLPDDEIMPVHAAAARYAARGVPLVVIAGERYGAGSARDWAAKATRLLGVRAVLARSFERIHRTNLVAMGVLPLELPAGVELELDGDETLDLAGVRQASRPGGLATLTVLRNGRTVAEVPLRGRVETQAEAAWLSHGGLLPKILADACED